MVPQTRTLIGRGPASVCEAGPVWFVADLLDEARVVEIVGLAHEHNSTDGAAYHQHRHYDPQQDNEFTVGIFHNSYLILLS